MIKMVEFAMFSVWLGIGMTRLGKNEPVPAHIYFLETFAIAIEHLIRAVGA